ncbi:hypothetical protein JTF04_02725 [Mammaliicoccus vitulinus]|uniref:hypothetical protein n=1 Tax=Mammaliicoccus vitulinus TaxID=71237 RepID=UPI001951EE8A|nr:hypothetical protein [Mammaliicoccus vitulinus]MBM6628583.1 hypothetical protein [Mammaliicoccus vitulinus]
MARFYGVEVDFYATLKERNGGVFILFNCTDIRYENHFLWKPERHEFGEKDYYTLATEESEKYIEQAKHDRKIELDNHYIIEVKKDLYVQNATSNYFFKFTNDINKADVYEYKNAAMKHAEFVDGRVLNLKRYVEVE